MKTFFLSHTTKNYPRLPYEKIKEGVLGATYQLSLTFIGTTRAQTLNQTHRKKTYVPNVLSFPLDKNIGEIFITPSVAKKEAKKFNMTETGYIGYLFIHALLHLKGYQHGATMEKAEKKYCTQYNIR